MSMVVKLLLGYRYNMCTCGNIMYYNYVNYKKVIRRIESLGQRLCPYNTYFLKSMDCVGDWDSVSFLWIFFDVLFPSIVISALYT